MRINGVFFDLGGTLFSYSGRMGGRGIKYILDEFNIKARPEEIGRSWGNAAKAAGERYGAMSYFLHRDLFRATLTHFLESFGHTPSEVVMDTFHRSQLEGMLEHLPIRDECHEALASLKQRGLYLSIVSNIDDDYLMPLVEKHGLDEHLDHWTSSEEAQSCKPDTQIYHYCLDKAGLAKDEVLFVGDSLHHDVAGAAAIGMRSARVVEPGIETPLTHGLKVTAQPNFEISNLTELIQIVDKTNGS